MLIKGNYLIIISGPSGVGKSSITTKLLASSKNLDFSISYTTRDKRPSETNNDHYIFMVIIYILGIGIQICNSTNSISKFSVLCILP